MDMRQFQINFLGDVSDSGTSIAFFYQKVLQDIWLYLFFRVEYPNTWQFCCQASWDVPHSQTSVFLVLIVILWMNTLKEETFAVPENREIFTYRGNKLSRMTSYERFHGNKKRRKSKFVRRNIRFYCTVLR